MALIDEKLIDGLVSISKTLIDLTKESMEKLTSLTDIFIEKIKEIDSLAISPKKKKELEYNCELFINNGWMISSFLKYTTLMNHVDTANINDYYMECHGEEKISKIYSKYEKYFDEYDINELKSLIGHNNYKASCLLLISLVEKTIMVSFSEYLNVSSSILKGKMATNKIKKDIANMGFSMSDLFLYLRGYSLCMYINELYKSSEKFEENDNDFKIPNRHYLMHGRSKRLYSYKDCLSLIVFIYELIMFLENIK